MFAPRFERRKRSAAADVNGPTVLEPSAVIVPDTALALGAEVPAAAPAVTRSATAPAKTPTLQNAFLIRTPSISVVAAADCRLAPCWGGQTDGERLVEIW